MMSDIHDQIERAKDFARTKAETAAERLKSGNTATREGLSEAKKKAGAAYATAKDRGYRLAGTANRLVNEHPLAATAAAVAVGAAVAMLFPRVRRAAGAALKATPATAEKAGTRALTAARSIGTAIAESDLLAAALAKAEDAASVAREKAAEAASATGSRAAEVASATAEKASEAAARAREAIVQADIPAYVRTKAAEARDAARTAIENARIPERASRIAESAASHTGEALIAAGKRVREKYDPD
jgi:ElaB/YqjD/DUF883 family membrane-anchored ribosome-binding protein